MITDPQFTPAALAEANYHWAVWDAAQQFADRRDKDSSCPLHQVWDALVAEAAAWAALVECVERHGLASTAWDPRPVAGGAA